MDEEVESMSQDSAKKSKTPLVDPNDDSEILATGTSDQATGKEKAETDDATQRNAEENEIEADGPTVEEGNGENDDVQAANDADISKEPDHAGAADDSIEAKIGVDDDNSQAETKAEGEEGGKGSDVEDAENEHALFGTDESSSDEEDEPPLHNKSGSAIADGESSDSDDAAGASLKRLRKAGAAPQSRRPIGAYGKEVVESATQADRDFIDHEGDDEDDLAFYRNQNENFDDEVDDAFEERDQIDPDDNENFESRTIVEKIEDQLKQKNRKSQQAKDSDAIANKELCEDVMRKMLQAVEEDDESCRNKQPQLAKVKILSEVAMALKNKQLVKILMEGVDLGDGGPPTSIGHVLGLWLDPTKMICVREIRDTLYPIIDAMGFQTTNLEEAPNFGRALLANYFHKKETTENKMFLKALVERWFRRIVVDRDVAPSGDLPMRQNPLRVPRKKKQKRRNVNELKRALKKPKLSVPALKVGLAIEARYEGGAKFLAGKITQANPDGTYEVEYQNGDVEQDVKKRMIRIPGANIKTKSQIPQKYAYAMRPDELQFVPGQLKGGRRHWEHFKEWGYNINKKGEATSTVKTSRMSQPESEELRSLKLKMRSKKSGRKGWRVNRSKQMSVEGRVVR